MGNVDFGPCFVDPPGDYRLSAESNCIDLGEPSFHAPPGALDLDGNKRVWDGDDDGLAHVDMGAYEFASPCYGDLNCDGSINGYDIDPFVLALTNPEAYRAALPDCDYILADTNADGLANAFDIDPFVLLLTR